MGDLMGAPPLLLFQGTEEVDTAPGAPQQRSQSESHTHQAEIKELQRRFGYTPDVSLKKKKKV